MGNTMPGLLGSAWWFADRHRDLGDSLCANFFGFNLEGQEPKYRPFAIRVEPAAAIYALVLLGQGRRSGMSW